MERALPETLQDNISLQANGNPALCAFRPSCPTGFSGGVFRLFYKVLGLPGASGRGLRQSSFGRLILDDFGGHFEAHLGSFLECIFGILYANIIILMHDMMACSMILYDALVYHNYIKHSLK